MSKFKLNSGNVLELYEPPNSAQGPMMEGRCAGCHNGLNGYVGHCACIRELVNGDESDVVWGAFSTTYGHFDCVQALWLKIVESLSKVDEPVVHAWRRGTQRDMVLFIQHAGLQGHNVATTYDPAATRDQRYGWRLLDDQEETE